MATYYLGDADISAGVLETLLTSAPSSLDEAQGWQCDKLTSKWAVYDPDYIILRTDAAWVASEPVSFSQQGYRTADALSGSFATGAWTLYWKVKCNTYYAQDGLVAFRLWKSANADGTGATQITAGWVYTGTISFSAANEYQSGNQASPSIDGFAMSGEYLFLEVLWKATVSGGNNSAAVYWVHNEGAAEQLVTPAFTTVVNATVTPTALSVAAAVVAPGETATANLAPTALSVAAALVPPAPAATAVVSPAALSVAASLQAVSLVAGALFEATALAVSLGLPAPVIVIDNPAADATFFATALAVVAGTPAPSVAAGATVTPAVLGLLVEARPATVLGGAVIEPVTLEVVAALHAPAMEVRLHPTALTVVATLLPPAVLGTAEIVVPDDLAVAVALLQPMITTAEIEDALVLPSVLGVTVGLGVPTLEASALVEATGLALALGLPAPVLVGSALVLPASLAAAVGLNVPQAEVRVAPNALAVQAAVEHPTLEGTAIVLPAALAASLGLPSPAVVIVSASAVAHRRTPGTHRAGAREDLP